MKSSSRLLKIIGLFCRISSLLKGSFAKETYNFKEPTNRSHRESLANGVNSIQKDSWCSVWQCVAMCGSAWQCVAVRGSAWQCVAVRRGAVQYVAVRGSAS